ncbi:hypothetical protein ESCO_000644 [Escovopsis weberi]|uniref:Uncharacterized protein n=1 Tax=Escovopsis weberi TaxID=150374 RepID=A0A0M8MYN1_ESCWE|nr:hypothetical protein ESCO_000644 [Escovopsis weberi]
MASLKSISWVVVDNQGAHDPVHTFRLLRQQELARPNPNLAAQLSDLSFESICSLLAVDPGAPAAETYGALLPSETMMRLQESSWESIKTSLERELAQARGPRAVVRIGLMERLEETAGDTIAVGYY